MTTVAESTSRSPLERLKPWVAPISLGALLTGLWTVVQFFNPIKELDLTVWIQEDIAFSLPKEATTLKKLALVYDGQPVEQASLFRVSILNSGKAPIQGVGDGPTKRWLLTLRSTNGVPIEQVGELRRTPSTVEIVSQPGPTPDSLQLSIGLLNPKDSIDLRIALLGPRAQSRFPLDAEDTTRIPGLRKPEVTTSNVRERIQNAFIAPLWIVAIVLVLAWFGWALHKERWQSFRSVGSAIGSIILLPFAAAFASAALAAGASWGLAWVVYFVALH